MMKNGVCGKMVTTDAMRERSSSEEVSHHTVVSKHDAIIQCQVVFIPYPYVLPNIGDVAHENWMGCR